MVQIQSNLERGVKVQPLVKMSGEGGFNEVLFDNLEVPLDACLEQPGEGWRIAMTTLQHERGAGGLVTPEGGVSQGEQAVQVNSEALVTLARRSAGAADSAGAQRTADADPLLRDRIAQLAIRERALAVHGRRAAVSALTDHPDRLALQNKLLSSELAQDTAALALDIAGPAATLYMGDANAPDDGLWPRSYMNSFGATIAAGTSEIQRNILGERVLGLPRSK